MNDCSDCRYFNRKDQYTCNLGNNQTIAGRCSDWEPIWLSATRDTFAPPFKKGERE